jgi:selenocysteine lyase/cysteine desulfurase
VANATSAIKLVAESFRDLDPRGFWYGYHIDSRTSIVGVRELANMGYECVRDVDVDACISEMGPEQSRMPKLLAFPAQSNLNGRRLPFHSIIALGAAFDTRIYGSMANISAHTGLLAKQIYDSLSSLSTTVAQKSVGSTSQAMGISRYKSPLSLSISRTVEANRSLKATSRH